MVERKNKPASQKEEEVKLPSEPTFRWKVVGGSPFHGGNHRIYKPGEVFVATELEVPLAFRDVIVKIDYQSVEEQTKVIPGKVPVYSLKEREKQDPDNEDEEILFDVVNHKGKKINETPFTKEKAKVFIEDLMA
jgi:hypothetical protein